MMEECAYVLVTFASAEFEYPGIVSDEGDAYGICKLPQAAKRISLHKPLEG